MYMCHNLNDTNIWDSLFEDLRCVAPEGEVQEPAMPVQAQVYALRACFYSLLWALHEAEERGEGEGVLGERLAAYAALCRRVAARGAGELREEAYVSLCDLLLVFAAGRAPAPAPALEPDAALCDLLNDFVQELVFVHHNYGNATSSLSRPYVT